eukprot:2984649-Amphidinium_carterae.1
MSFTFFKWFYQHLALRQYPKARCTPQWQQINQAANAIKNISSPRIGPTSQDRLSLKVVGVERRIHAMVQVLTHNTCNIGDVLLSTLRLHATDDSFEPM